MSHWPIFRLFTEERVLQILKATKWRASFVLELQISLTLFKMLRRDAINKTNDEKSCFFNPLGSDKKSESKE